MVKKYYLGIVVGTVSAALLAYALSAKLFPEAAKQLGAALPPNASGGQPQAIVKLDYMDRADNSIKSTKPEQNIREVKNDLSLSAQLRRADNYRYYVDTAMRQLQNGGGFYANIVLDSCGFLAAQGSATRSNSLDVGAPSHAEAQRAQKVRADLETKCGQLLDSETSVKQIFANKEKLNDPFLQAMSKISSFAGRRDGVGRDAAESAVARIFDSQSPEMLQRLVINTYIVDNKAALYFDGKYVSLDSETARLLPIASQLAACKLGDYCDASDLQLDIHCALSGMCPANVQEHIGREISNIFGEESAAKFLVVQEMAGRILASYKSRKVSDFLPDR